MFTCSKLFLYLKQHLYLKDTPRLLKVSANSLSHFMVSCSDFFSQSFNFVNQEIYVALGSSRVRDNHPEKKYSPILLYITSNDRQFGCPIIYTDILLQCHFVQRDLQQMHNTRKRKAKGRQRDCKRCKYIHKISIRFIGYSGSSISASVR